MSPKVHHLTAKRKDSEKGKTSRQKKRRMEREKKPHGKKNKTRGKRKKLAAKEITSRSKRAFCCACSVKF